MCQLFVLIARAQNKCIQCKGNKVIQEKKMLEVHVEKGMQDGQKIVFHGEAHEAAKLFVFFFLMTEDVPTLLRKKLLCTGTMYLSLAHHSIILERGFDSMTLGSKPKSSTITPRPIQ